VTVALPSGTTLSVAEVTSKTRFFGGVIFGGVVSVMVIICVAFALLPASSVAVQVTVVLPSGKTAGALLVTDLISPLSVTVALPSGTTLSVAEVTSKTTFFGGVIFGGVVSVMVIICVELAVL